MPNREIVCRQENGSLSFRPSPYYHGEFEWSAYDGGGAWVWFKGQFAQDLPGDDQRIYRLGIQLRERADHA